jgi:hypothetical protein
MIRQQRVRDSEAGCGCGAHFVAGWLRSGGGRWTLVAEGLEANVRAALQAEAAELRACDTTILPIGIDPNRRRTA